MIVIVTSQGINNNAKGDITSYCDTIHLMMNYMYKEKYGVVRFEVLKLIYLQDMHITEST